MRAVSSLLLALFLFFQSNIASADLLNFQVVGAYPNVYGSRTLVVDVYNFPTTYTCGWKEFYMNINGYNYPINGWNAYQTGPFTARASFVVPAWYPQWNRLQMWINFYVGWESSYPQSIWF